MPSYIGRFAPSPTGPLHAGSLVAALASWLDARANRGQWLVRIEDVDTQRCVPGADQTILQQLAASGLYPDAPPTYQSQRGSVYQNALDQLVNQSRAYPCGCSRQGIEQAVAASGPSGGTRERHGELVYPGICRAGLMGKPARSWRFASSPNQSNQPVAHKISGQAAPYLIANSDSETVSWTDRLMGLQSQNVSAEVGDFVLKRADGLWAYQLAVVVDDAAQGITHVVRGQDLADNTARQMLLQTALGLPHLQYLHTPLVFGVDGEKLSKQNGAQALNLSNPGHVLMQAGQHLGIACPAAKPADWLPQATAQWAARFKIPT